MLSVILGLALASYAAASSHSEGLGTLEKPQLDLTDLYAFKSYEVGRQDFVTILLNFNPLQDRFGGPFYAPASDSGAYEIYIDNDHDGDEDITFSFLFGGSLSNNGEGIEIPVGHKKVAVPLSNVAQIMSSTAEPGLNFKENFRVRVLEGNVKRHSNRNYEAGSSHYFTRDEGGHKTTIFRKPYDNAGSKTFPNGYENYADGFKYSNVHIPNCAHPGRVFAGPRRESFPVNLGKVFDLVNFVPIVRGGLNNSVPGFENAFIENSPCNNVVGEKTITTIAVEIHSSCLKGKDSNILGIWGGVRQIVHQEEASSDSSSESSEQVHRYGRQVNRIGMPLFNELLVGAKDKDIYNYVKPTADRHFFSDYVNFPTLPEILNILFRGAVNANLGASLTTIAPKNFPRNDLFTLFFKGIKGLNQPENFKKSAEVLRLNIAIPAVPAAQQNELGVLGGDNAGYPNGRRPGDDVVDISLDAVMGRLCHAGLGLCNPSDAVVGNVFFTDGANLPATSFASKFPYLNSPYGGDQLYCDIFPSCCA